MPKRKCYYGNVEPLYDQWFDTFRMKSKILKGESTISSNLNEKQGLQIQLDILVGTKDGKYYYGEGKYFKTAVIHAVETELDVLQIEFLNYQQTQINQGFRKPETWPANLKEQKLKLEARLDVYNEEVAWLERAIARWVDEKEESRDVLNRGCVQSGRLYGGVLVELDGQRIGISKKGVLYVDDNQSPYDGMSVVDYREKICSAFRIMEKEKDAAVLKRLQAEAREWGRPVP